MLVPEGRCRLRCIVLGEEYFLTLLKASESCATDPNRLEPNTTVCNLSGLCQKTLGRRWLSLITRSSSGRLNALGMASITAEAVRASTLELSFLLLSWFAGGMEKRACWVMMVIVRSRCWGNRCILTPESTSLGSFTSSRPPHRPALCNSKTIAPLI
jgi:hypothetical protein